MKIADQNPAYQREVKRITKKHKLDDSFLPELYKSISRKPTQQPDARIVRDHGSYQIVKRYVLNPKEKAVQFGRASRCKGLSYTDVGLQCLTFRDVSR